MANEQSRVSPLREHNSFMKEPIHPIKSAYTRLMKSFVQSEGQSTESRWRWLMAAHIVGQQHFIMHCHSHISMLRFSLQTRDYGEMAGQLFRLVLVPLGHLGGKLPIGNIGRATVNAFKPMALEPDIREMIANARSTITAK